MNLEPLGILTRDPDIDEWLRSDGIPVPLFENHPIPFILEYIEADTDRRDFTQAVSSFLALTATDRAEAAPHMFKVYREFCDAVDEEDVDCHIDDVTAVWNHVHPTAIHVSRRHRHDKDVYVQVTAECDWEIEHGLQLVFRKGATLSRVSNQDGHLTTTDAYDLPEEQDRITY